MRTRFTISGAPQGKARPRVTMHGTYTPAKTKAYENLIRSEYSNQSGVYYGDNALFLHIIAYYAVPKSKPKYIKEKMLKGEIRPTVKPDDDNITKAVQDALNGLAWKDDAQVVTLFVEKWYDENQRVEVTIEEAVLR